MDLKIQNFIGSEVKQVIQDLAELRITVFREFPYLYDGSIEYEKEYLQPYVDCPESITVVVFESDKVVGASTGLPLAAADADFRKPFEDNERFSVNSYFYCAESVLLPDYRWNGLGHRFFDERENHARSLPGITEACFCAVERPLDHPARPTGYHELTKFWEKRGYQKKEELATEFPWKEIGEDEETMKPMTFWVRSL